MKNIQIKETQSRRVHLRYREINICLHFIDDYSACVSGRNPRWLVRLLPHQRCARQQRPLSNTDRFFLSQLLPQLISGEWCELTFTIR
jgi:hypothetical protein